jgi:hypothetical protein
MSVEFVACIARRLMIHRWRPGFKSYENIPSKPMDLIEDKVLTRSSTDASTGHINLSRSSTV